LFLLIPGGRCRCCFPVVALLQTLAALSFLLLRCCRQPLCRCSHCSRCWYSRVCSCVPLPWPSVR
jgi:hypothetical protein